MSKTTMTVNELAACLQIGKSAAYQLIRTEGFPSIKIGRQIRIPIRLLERWIALEAVKSL